MGRPKQLAAVTLRFSYGARRFRGEFLESLGNRPFSPSRGARGRIPDDIRKGNGWRFAEQAGERVGSRARPALSKGHSGIAGSRCGGSAQDDATSARRKWPHFPPIQVRPRRCLAEGSGGGGGVGVSILRKARYGPLPPGEMPSRQSEIADRPCGFERGVGFFGESSNAAL